jgi:hypothetical protein
LGKRVCFSCNFWYCSEKRQTALREKEKEKEKESRNGSPNRGTDK